jgi:hypothetical protein
MILRIREIGNSSDDGAVWPVPSGEQNGCLVDLEEWDGKPDQMRWMTVTGVLEQEILPGGAKTLTQLTKVSGFAYVTEARLIVAIEKFDQGSTYIGFGGVAVIASLAATGISKARAAHRRKGKVLVGQVRWQWIKVLAAQPNGLALRNHVRAEQVELDFPDDVGDAGLAGLAGGEVTGFLGLARARPVRAVPYEGGRGEDLQQERGEREISLVRGKKPRRCPSRHPGHAGS